MTQVGNEGRYDLWGHLLPTLLLSIPMASGLWSDCLASLLSTHYAFPPPSGYYPCRSEQSLWAGGYVLLLAFAAIMAVAALVRARCLDRNEATKQSARLLLLFAALITIVAYI